VDAVRLRLFPFSLLGKTKQCFYANREAIDKWGKCLESFLKKIFPLGKTNALPHHGMEDWLIIKSFYNGLTLIARGHINVAAQGAFFSLTIDEAKSLIKKMVSNQGWSDE
jgi:hypothetical protein